eukprot:s197_g27.t1
MLVPGTVARGVKEKGAQPRTKADALEVVFCYVILMTKTTCGTRIGFPLVFITKPWLYSHSLGRIHRDGEVRSTDSDGFCYTRGARPQVGGMMQSTGP